MAKKAPLTHKDIGLTVHIVPGDGIKTPMPGNRCIGGFVRGIIDPEDPLEPVWFNFNPGGYKMLQRSDLGHLGTWHHREDCPFEFEKPE